MSAKDRSGMLECMSFFLRPLVQHFASNVAEGLTKGRRLGLQPHVRGLAYTEAAEVFKRDAHAATRPGVTGILE